MAATIYQSESSWVDCGATAIDFYIAAYGAKMLHRVGDGEDVVAELVIDGAAFRITAVGTSAIGWCRKRCVGRDARVLLVVEDPTPSSPSGRRCRDSQGRGR